MGRVIAAVLLASYALADCKLGPKLSRSPRWGAGRDVSRGQYRTETRCGHAHASGRPNHISTAGFEPRFHGRVQWRRPVSVEAGDVNRRASSEPGAWQTGGG